MNWRNPFLTGYLALTVVGVGLFGYLAYSASTHYAEVSETYDTQVQRLQKLQNRRPFPSDENNAKMRALSAEYRAEYDQLVQAFSRMQRPLEAITPQTFQDRLRDYVSAVNAAAKQNGVALNEDFYLGFDQYRNALPTSEAAPALARELDAIRFVVDSLITSKVREIKGIKRDLLTEEGARPAATPAPRPGAPAAPKPAPTPASLISTSAFNIIFIADQGRFRQALNTIVSAPQFFVIRSLNVQNEKLEGPSQNPETPGEAPAAGSAPAASGDPLAALLAAPAAGATDGASPAAAASSMRLLVGRELLTVGARIEILNFIPPTAASR